jgi:AcrR family transcriptional regulator
VIAGPKRASSKTAKTSGTPRPTPKAGPPETARRPGSAGTTRRTRTSDVRPALVDAAVEVLESDGVSGLTVRAVAAAAGVAPMGVYNHLGGKPGLLVAVLIRGFDGLRDAITVREPMPYLLRLRAAGHGYRRFARSRPVTYGLMFGPSQGPHDPELEVHAEAAFQALVDLVVLGQAGGDLLADDSYDVALRIWATVHGAVSLEIAGSAKIVDADQTYERVLDLIERGLSADRPSSYTRS